MVSVEDLKTEYLTNPLGLEAAVPRFSWQLRAAGRGARQTAYRVLAASCENRLRPGYADVWDSGRVTSDRCFEVDCAGRPLRSGERVYWRAWAWDQNDEISAPSAVAWFEMGLLKPDDWQASWIEITSAEEAGDRAAGMQWIWADGGLDDVPVQFRFRFDISDTSNPARLLVSAKDNLLGVWVNGKSLPRPASVFWGTMSEWPIELRRGENIVCIEASALTDGFLAPDGGAVAALIRTTNADGTVQRFVSGPSWRTCKGAKGSWPELDYDDRDWATAVPSGARIACEPWPTGPAMSLRRRFEIAKPMLRARFYATALGIYEAFINGARISEARLAPEISSADRHVYYQCYDVTDHLNFGGNMLGVLVADGWYAGAFGWRHERFGLGDGPRRFLGQLVIDYRGGDRDIVACDDQWRTKPSPIVAADIYGGEHYDARMEDPDWATHRSSDAGWAPVRIGKDPRVKLVSLPGPSIHATEVRRPVSVRGPAPGVRVADFGQNFSGWCRLHTKGAAGTKVELRHGELLLLNGQVDQTNLRGSAATDSYILRGDADGEVYEPRFTYHGFRFVEWNAPGVIEGVVAHSALPSTGKIRVENDLVQRICDNTAWSQRSNFFGVPTDCPQRDERMGWLGDIQVFLDAASFIMDTDAFIRHFLREIRAGQSAEGAFPVVAPQPRAFPTMLTAGWSEAGIILPWTLYQRYGDTRVIDENWLAMTRWMDFLAKHNPDWLWRNRRGLDLGDWLSVDTIQPADETTPRMLIATAFWAYASELMADMAAATGRMDEARRYAQSRAAIGKAFAAEFVGPQGTIGNGSQTSHVLALAFGLVPEAAREAVAAHLVTDIAGRGTKLSTGFLGTPYLLDVLCEHGHADVAIALLLQSEYPSWGYMVSKGATTMWERWNGDVGDIAMNSFNHYAFGAVTGFIYRRLAGIAPAGPGFRRIAVRPVFDQRVGRVEAEYKSCLGPIASTVDGDADGLAELALMVPANAAAEVHLPSRHHWRESGKPLDGRDDIGLRRGTTNEIVLDVGSGEYRFTREA